MGTMPDGTQRDSTNSSTHRSTQGVSTHGTVQLDDGIVPDPSLPPTSVDESVRDSADRNWTPAKIALWAAIALLGGVAWLMLAIVRGETVNAIWFVFAAVCTYLIGYRFYSKVIERYIAQARRPPRHAGRVQGERQGLRADGPPRALRPPLRRDRRRRPAGRPGHSRRRWATCPARIWIIVGVVLAGAVQDYLVLFFSMRRGGRSLGQMAREELGVDRRHRRPASPRWLIMVIIVAILALVVVNALGESPWGVFSVGMTIPIALFMGVYLRFFRPGKVMEVSVIGFVLLMAAIIGGGAVAGTEWGAAFFHLDRHDDRLGHHHLRLHRRGAARLAAAGPARLPLHLHEDRRDRDAGRGDRRGPSRDHSSPAVSEFAGRERAARSSPAPCSRSCSSRSPAARCPASTP